MVKKSLRVVERQLRSKLSFQLFDLCPNRFLIRLILEQLEEINKKES